MKKFAIVLTMLATLVGQTITAPKAEAGVMTVLGNLANNHHHKDPVGGIVVGGLITWAGFALARAQDIGWHVVGIVLIVLDANKEVRQDAIEQFITEKYSFIDDREAVSDLAALIKNKIETSGGKYSEMTIRVPETEVRGVLAATSLSAEQIQVLVDDLK